MLETCESSIFDANSNRSARLDSRFDSNENCRCADPYFVALTVNSAIASCLYTVTGKLFMYRNQTKLIKQRKNNADFLLTGQ